MGMLGTEYFEERLVLVDTQPSTGTPAAGPLNGAKLLLAVADFTPTVLIAPGNITQPTTVSFTPPVLTWGAANRDPLGNIQTLSDVVPVQSADGAPYTVYGYMVVDSGGTHALIAERFANPQALADALSLFNLQIPFVPAAPNDQAAFVWG